MYDANKSYLQNYDQGPDARFVIDHHFPRIQYTGTPKFTFLGIPLFIPFGVPAGPLLNAKYVKVALDAGFCLPTYKTVRSCAWESHPWPNVLKINHTNNEQLFATSTPTVIGSPFTPSDYQQKNLSISNSFGVPSQIPEIWSKDFQTLKSYAEQTGLHVVLSFQGSKTKKNLYDDIAQTCEYAVETLQHTGYCLLEINLSCPNEVNEPIYKSVKDSVHALKCAHQIVSGHKNLKLIAKIGALSSEDTHVFVSEVGQYVNAISAINTVFSKILDKNGNPVLGSASFTGGVCGSVILTQGIIMCENLAKSREKCGLKPEQLGLIGVGGVSEVTHFNSYRDAGADVVQAATGMMWNLNLAKQVAQSLNISFDERSL